jgi:hypothetical protein
MRRRSCCAVPFFTVRIASARVSAWNTVPSSGPYRSLPPTPGPSGIRARRVASGALRERVPLRRWDDKFWEIPDCDADAKSALTTYRHSHCSRPPGSCVRLSSPPPQPDHDRAVDRRGREPCPVILVRVRGRRRYQREIYYRECHSTEKLLESEHCPDARLANWTYMGRP